MEISADTKILAMSVSAKRLPIPKLKEAANRYQNCIFSYFFLNDLKKCHFSWPRYQNFDRSKDKMLTDTKRF